MATDGNTNWVRFTGSVKAALVITAKTIDMTETAFTLYHPRPRPVLNEGSTATAPVCTSPRPSPPSRTAARPSAAPRLARSRRPVLCTLAAVLIGRQACPGPFRPGRLRARPARRPGRRPGPSSRAVVLLRRGRCPGRRPGLFCPVFGLPVLLWGLPR
ncbi:hypothetical protein GCM10025734_00010 [Kitasatospora paranensis]